MGCEVILLLWLDDRILHDSAGGLVQQLEHYGNEGRQEGAETVAKVRQKVLDCNRGGQSQYRSRWSSEGAERYW